jgi:hypothetical protein
MVLFRKTQNLSTEAVLEASWFLLFLDNNAVETLPVGTWQSYLRFPVLFLNTPHSCPVCPRQTRCVAAARPLESYGFLTVSDIMIYTLPFSIGTAGFQFLQLLRNDCTNTKYRSCYQHFFKSCAKTEKKLDIYLVKST